ncbi:DUF2325 domain-containing protein [Nitrosomonas sp. ANs5]|uniref:DUF2325 domain-containing protein n=1 Tax=Nitrosomonas sp. ANs5 TaxID=3423941 RepID=UPI003D34AC0A
MKSLKPNAFAPAYQGTPSLSGTLSGNPHAPIPPSINEQPITELKRLFSQIWKMITQSFRSTAGNTATIPSAPAAPLDTLIDRRSDYGTPTAARQANMHWVKLNGKTLHYGYLTIARQPDACQSLAGRSVLCVGGQAALYPDYHRLIEAIGGHFMAFRGGAQDNSPCLLALLECVDLVICPVDCVNHQDFFTVKHYCQRTGKYCAMLERSNLATFGKAVEGLVLHYHCQTGSHLSTQSATQ